MDRHKVISTDTAYDKLHFDYKSKLLQGEQDQIIQRQTMKELHRVADLHNANNP